jgi:hypothetical protein
MPRISDRGVEPLSICYYWQAMSQLSNTAAYRPPSQGLPFLAVVLDPERVVRVVRQFATEAEAHGFLQAFMQEKAGEYGFPPDNTWMGGGS